ncbi:fumarylacetoacetate hydrolase family protein [Cellulomonas fimi]|uniref:Fumarylacetoacetate (FAA) hydrolase n=1 Tax=Cellulomonas fimi (strain ATCC 484 / DSM 20113 / JCM 1341 / CCUG 24087 / LMG 16345 / NBRC 15513 / NCIMB 8980 / NCTC 7547 / NRS-133) TaxID=590998 RepID=F4GYJ8_CELFA|nr:fumarylacetoacetate hydrolase family protein [Cellulomonas fimi]AEE47115.1 fumarylacetoacetate (FAA) hydrolase [Cellulomonas fimi ATCC 484]VEH35297.1 2-keto-4-pentenoate hydratase/2-oxohepta-3-ene-1,7-dioic acid hydratase (catechol pathway) [Cellulomonas fimi]
MPHPASLPSTTAFGLGMFLAGGRRFPGLVVGAEVLDLCSLPQRFTPVRTTSEILADWEHALPTLALLADERPGLWQPLDRLTVLPPVTPRQIVQAGANYRTHVIDLAVKHTELSAGRSESDVRAEAAAMMDERARTGIPYLFAGLPSAVTGAFDAVRLPGYSDQHDWELELVAVIGRPAYQVSRDDALDHVAAYTIANDLTTRDLVFRQDMPEIGTDWLRAKNAPGFLPLGPYLVPSALVGAPGDLRLTLSLNGEIKQDESAKDMLFDVATLVSHASHYVALNPGDLVLTGSPAGNGMHWRRFLRPGDVVDASISGLGAQRTEFVDATTGAWA